MLNRCKNVLPINVRRLIYNSLIQSHLEYGVLAWGSSKNKLITSINKIQKRCIRNLASGSWLSHTDPLFGKLNILKFKDILDVNSKIFMHKYFNSQLPGSFNDMFTLGFPFVRESANKKVRTRTNESTNCSFADGEKSANNEHCLHFFKKVKVRTRCTFYKHIKKIIS